MSEFSIHMIIGGDIDREVAADAITHFVPMSSLDAVVAQYGGRGNLAEANLAAHSEARDGEWALKRYDVVVACAKDGLVRKGGAQ